MPSNSNESTATTSTSYAQAPTSQTPVPLGRLATRIALTLMGKNKPIFNPSTDCGDYVVAVGCNDLHVTGKKLQQKLYYKQTTRPGSIRSMNMETLKAKWGGAEILRRAVRGMLPKNRLRDKRLSRLKSEHGSKLESTVYCSPLLTLKLSFRRTRAPLQVESPTISGGELRSDEHTSDAG